MTRRALFLLPIASARSETADDPLVTSYNDFTGAFKEWIVMYNAEVKGTISWPEFTKWKKVKVLWKRFAGLVDRLYEEGR